MGKSILFFIAYLLVIIISTAQAQSIRVAILDFENTSGIAKYDGLGKALSNMLITDLKNSIHPRKVTFLERSQLNKILEEQSLQKSKNFDNSTAVNFGKLAGVNYVLVGSVYVMDGTCNITSRLVDVQTSEIVHAKESNGSINKWLLLKTVLAQELSKAMNNPITIGAEYTEKETSEGVLAQYAKVIDKMDEGDVEGAQEMTEMLSAVQPDFKYFDELKLDIEVLKKELEALKGRVDVVEQTSTENKVDIKVLNDVVSGNKVYGNPNSSFEYLANARIYQNSGDALSAKKAYQKYFQLSGNKFIEPHLEYLNLLKQQDNQSEYSNALLEYKTKGEKDKFYEYINTLAEDDLNKRLSLLISFNKKHKGFALAQIEFARLSIELDQINWQTFATKYTSCEAHYRYQSFQNIFNKYLNQTELCNYYLDKSNCNDNVLSEIQSTWFNSWRDQMLTLVNLQINSTKQYANDPSSLNPEKYTFDWYLEELGWKWKGSCYDDWVKLSKGKWNE